MFTSKHNYLQQYKKATDDFYHYVDKTETEELLGWGSAQSQYIRFKILLKLAIRSFHLNSKDRLVDAGCGYGALLHYIQSSKQDIQYIGLDSNPMYIKKAKERFRNNQFYVFDLLDDVNSLPDTYDIAVVSGVLNLDLSPYYKSREKKEQSKYVIVKHILHMLCKNVKKGVVCNFLHINSPDKFPVFNYHKPSELIQYLESIGFSVIDKEEGYLDNDFTLAITTTAK